MQKFDELLKKLNELNIKQTSSDWAEDIPEDVWDEYFIGGYKLVANGLDVDKHRWYETCTDVIHIYGRFLGVMYVADIFSEQMNVQDCYVSIKFKEMKEVKTVKYVDL